MQTYHLVTNWFFNAPIERVWQEITAVEAWPQWWSCWKQAKLLNPEKRGQVGARIENVVKGSLPYSLRFTTELTGMDVPHVLSAASGGELVGQGQFVLQECDGGTAVTYTWDVGTANPLFNFFGKFGFVRDMIVKNHDYVMASGYRGLKPRVEKVSNVPQA